MLHAHWNLDHGGTAGALLSACRSALLDVRGSHRRLRQPGSGSPFLSPSRRGRGSGTPVSSSSASAEDEANHDVEPVLDDALNAFRQKVLRLASTMDHSDSEEMGDCLLLVSDVIEILERLAHDKDETPTSVGSTFADVPVGVAFAAQLTEDVKEAIRIGRSTTNLCGIQSESDLPVVHDELAAAAVADVAAVLLCLRWLGVKSVSYAPLPLCPTAPPHHVQRLVGLNVTLVSSTSSNGRFDAGTILFFHLLTRGRLKELSWHDSEPPVLKLVWQGGSGGTKAADDDDDKANENPLVTLTMGTKSLREATASTGAQHSQNETIDSACGEDLMPPSKRPWNVDRLVLLQTNVDDLTPEHCAFVMELVMSHAVALDAWTSPIGMKKGRTAAQQLSVLCTPDMMDNAMRMLFRHSRTLGIRQQFVDRASLRRRVVTVEAQWKIGGGQSNADAGARSHHGRVDIKVGYMLSSVGEEEVVSMKPEYDHCRAIALATGSPIQSIAEQALSLAQDLVNS